MNNSKSDSLNLLLANACNRGCTVKVRAVCIRRCAKAITQRSKDKTLKWACNVLRKTKDDAVLIAAVENKEQKYFGV